MLPTCRISSTSWSTTDHRCCRRFSSVGVGDSLRGWGEDCLSTLTGPDCWQECTDLAPTSVGIAALTRYGEVNHRVC